MYSISLHQKSFSREEQSLEVAKYVSALRTVSDLAHNYDSGFVDEESYYWALFDVSHLDDTSEPINLSRNFGMLSLQTLLPISVAQGEFGDINADQFILIEKERINKIRTLSIDHLNTAEREMNIIRFAGRAVLDRIGLLPENLSVFPDAFKDALIYLEADINNDESSFIWERHDSIDELAIQAAAEVSNLVDPAYVSIHNCAIGQLSSAVTKILGYESSK